MKPQKSYFSSESGNVFIIILIAIALFAALSAFLSRGTRTGEATITQEQARLGASELLTYSRSVKDSVQRLLIDGCDESELSFAYDIDGDGDFDDPVGYRNGNSPADHSCHIFHPNGGGISRQDGPFDDLEWRYMGRRWFDNAGADGVAELSMGVDNVGQAICEEVNNRIHNTRTVPSPIGSVNNAFEGTFGNPSALHVGDCSTLTSGPCLTFCGENPAPDPAEHIFYQVLISR